MRRVLPAWALAVVLWAAAPAGEDGFVPLFNGLKADGRRLP